MDIYEHVIIFWCLPSERLSHSAPTKWVTQCLFFFAPILCTCVFSFDSYFVLTKQNSNICSNDPNGYLLVKFVLHYTMWVWNEIFAKAEDYHTPEKWMCHMPQCISSAMFIFKLSLSKLYIKQPRLLVLCYMFVFHLSIQLYWRWEWLSPSTQL